MEKRLNHSNLMVVKSVNDLLKFQNSLQRIDLCGAIDFVRLRFTVI